jgi:hypothetical protein
MTQPLTEQQLDDIEARAAAATPGPWCTDSWEIYQGTEYLPGISLWIGETCRGTSTPEQDRNDAAFVAAARTDVPALLAEIRRLRAELITNRADVLGEVAIELEGIDFHPTAKATASDLCRLLAGRFRRKALDGLDAARPVPAAT